MHQFPVLAVPTIAPCPTWQRPESLEAANIRAMENAQKMEAANSRKAQITSYYDANGNSTNANAETVNQTYADTFNRIGLHSSPTATKNETVPPTVQNLDDSRSNIEGTSSPPATISSSIDMDYELLNLPETFFSAPMQTATNTIYGNSVRQHDPTQTASNTNYGNSVRQHEPTQTATNNISQVPHTNYSQRPSFNNSAGSNIAPQPKRPISSTMPTNPTGASVTFQEVEKKQEKRPIIPIAPQVFRNMTNLPLNPTPSTHAVDYLG